MELGSERAVVCVMARRPGSGAVKTRLAPRLGVEARARLYEAFLRDKLAQVSTVRGVKIALAVAPPDEPASMEPWRPAGALLLAQRGADLGARLAALAEEVLAAGARAVLIVDSDTPTLPPAYLEEAVASLESGEVDAVFGPAQDGGYYLVGLTRAQPTLFEQMPWSTSAVLRESLRAADAAGLRVHLLPSWYDVDEPSDLDRLLRELGAMPRFAAGYPRETAAALAREQLSVELEAPRDEHWATRSLRRAYANPWIDVTERVVTLPNGHVTLYGVVRTAPCVGVLPVVDGGSFLLVRQFRYVARRFTWEIPTGGVQAGEALEAAARRELREEANVEALTLRPVLSFDTSKSVVDETAHLFVAAVDLTREVSAPMAHDATEQIERRVFSRAEVEQLIAAGEIVDSMTLLALYATSSIATMSEAGAR